MQFLVGYVHDDQKFELINQTANQAHRVTVYQTGMHVSERKQLDLSAHVGRIVGLQVDRYYPNNDAVYGAKTITIQ